MRRSILSCALLLCASFPLQAAGPTTIPEAALKRADALRQQALADDTGWKVVESLTTEVGPRLAGSEADARAVAWAQAKFKQLGFDKVWTEPVTFPKWERRSEHAQVLGANAQHLVVTALGGSAGGTVEGEIVRFADLDALQAAPAGSLAGKIAFVDFQMRKKQDGGDYRYGGGIRGRGPSEAIKKGAIGFLMRSAGTTPHRVVNTGITRYEEGLTPIPAAAVSIPDADQLARLVARGPVKVRLSLDCGWDGQATSYNVIGQITGRSKPGEIVLTGGHLDSWGPGHGRHRRRGRHRHFHGGRQTRRPAAPGAHDPRGRLRQRGAGPVRRPRLRAGARQGDRPARHRRRERLRRRSYLRLQQQCRRPCQGRDRDDRRRAQAAGCGLSARPGRSGVGHRPMAQLGMRWAWLGHDGTDYFDLHHNADDTLDKIDPKVLAQNVAAYAVFLYLAAEAKGDFGSAPVSAGANKEAH